MKQQDFLARFKTKSTHVSADFDRAELARWAAEFQAGLPARHDALTAQFQQALELAGGKFYKVESPGEASQIVCELVRSHGVQSVAAWNHPLLAPVCAALRSSGTGVTVSDRSAGLERDAIRSATIASDIGLTSCSYAIAETGTLVLVADERQGRLTSLVPITHVALITADQLVPQLNDAIKLLRLQRLDSADGLLPSNISLHTGPSKTADIEQTLTTGVHGPKEVHVILQGVSHD
jgi:L-lactate dehydrogenase complex protein LldG